MKKATVEAHTPKERDKSKLILMSKTASASSAKSVIAQLRLARIQQLQSDIAYLQNQLSNEWNAVRRDLLAGAVVEKGPLRAWIKCILRLGHARALKERNVSKTLMVK